VPTPSTELVAEWLQAARTGSREALGKLLDLFRGYLLLVAAEEIDPRLLPKGSASDLVQETFLEAHRDFARFQGNSDEELKAWLRKILVNNLANFSRRYRDTGKRAVDREVAVALDGLADDGPCSAGTRAVARERMASLEQALAQLSPDHRQVLWLRYQEQLSFDEVANRLNRSANAARKLWARAVEELHRQLEALHDVSSGR
jgi:RNA polymerase sigma-70 factor (ECF subfamily)